MGQGGLGLASDAERGQTGANVRLLLAFALIALPYQASVALQERFAPESPVGPALMLVALLACLPAAWIVRGSRFSAFGLGLKRGWWLLLFATLCVAFLARLATILAGLWLGWAVTSAPSPLPGAVGIAALLAITFIPSLVEDVMTRGIPLASRLYRSGLLRFAAISAVLYTANHLWRFDWGVSEQVRLMCMGLAYAAACWRWRSLWAAVGLHWGWNLANALSGAVWPVEWADETAMRLAAALVHLAIFAAIALLPGRDRQTELD